MRLSVARPFAVACRPLHAAALGSAFFANMFSPSLAPAIYDHAAGLFVLLTVWLATSPRLEMPMRPLLGWPSVWFALRRHLAFDYATSSGTKPNISAASSHSQRSQ
jgi:hypothetical protein